MKIAVKSNSAPPDLQSPGRLCTRVLAEGNAWRVRDVVCSAGPRDRAFEEQHTKPSIAIVIEGSFQYRSHAGRELMTPGSLLLGNPGQCFECGHEHAIGDRCLSFEYEPVYFESIAAEAAGGNRTPRFTSLRVPPVRELSALVARALAMVAGSGSSATQSRSLSKQRDNAISNSPEWEEVAVELVGRSLSIAGTPHFNRTPLPAAEARARIAEEGVLVGALRPGVLRVATYLGVTDDDVERALEAIPRALNVQVAA